MMEMIVAKSFIGLHVLGCHSDHFLITFDLKCIPIICSHIMKCFKYYIKPGIHEYELQGVCELMEDFHKR